MPGKTRDEPGGDPDIINDGDQREVCYGNCEKMVEIEAWPCGQKFDLLVSARVSLLRINCLGCEAGIYAAERVDRF